MARREIHTDDKVDCDGSGSIMFYWIYFRISLETSRDGRTGHEGEPPRLEDADEVQCEVSLPGTEHSEVLVRRLDLAGAKSRGQRDSLGCVLLVLVSLLIIFFLKFCFTS